MIKILFVSKNKREKEALRYFLDDGFRCFFGHSIMEEKKRIIQLSPDIILIDSKEIQDLRYLTGFYNKGCIILTGLHLTPQLTVSAIKLGIDDVVPFPLDCDFLGDILRKKVALRKSYKISDKNSGVLDQIIGTHPTILDLKKKLQLYSRSKDIVCIEGETGSGKSFTAEILHNLRHQSGEAPFICRNCASIPQTLFESEAFGTEKGAYTGAVTRPGFMELADNGTLFLDEIGTLDLTSQAKFLDVVERRQFYRLGGRHIISISSNIIVATNSNLSDMCRKKLFRDDLYYRIKTLPLKIPPLRSRMEDLPLLVAEFLKNSGKKISVQALDCLLGHCWPGNIRELQTVLKRACLVSAENKEIYPRDIIFDDDLFSTGST